MNGRHYPPTVGRRAVRIEVLEEYSTAPVEINVIPAGAPGDQVLPALLSRPRCGQEARKEVALAPRHTQMVDGNYQWQQRTNMTPRKPNGRAPSFRSKYRNGGLSHDWNRARAGRCTRYTKPMNLAP
jgi:hypothetical protein